MLQTITAVDSYDDKKVKPGKDSKRSMLLKFYLHCDCFNKWHGKNLAICVPWLESFVLRIF